MVNLGFGDPCAGRDWRGRERKLYWFAKLVRAGNEILGWRQVSGGTWVRRRKPGKIS